MVFDSIEDYTDRIDNPDVEVDADTVLVLRNSGPRGYPGMPEVGNLALPKPLLQQGITDMVRISDARMSGTSYGTVVLHAAPEAAVGGPLALVRDGDEIELDVPGRRLDLLVDPEELEQRRRAWTPPQSQTRGWTRLYVDHVLQADRGADLDFLVGRSGAPVPRRSL
ncbi:MAG: dihydroxy-acid dehydratase [Sciscionella sp.]